MSDKINDGGPAFPTFAIQLSPVRNSYNEFQTIVVKDKDGMSLRDYFAGQVIAALGSDALYEGNAELYARKAYELADAMLDERAKRQDPK